ncbi:Protein transport protein Sec31A, partial [Araneus ventricosus]
MKPLTDEDMDEILRVSRDASMDDDVSSTDSWTDSSTDSSTDDEMNASTDECQAISHFKAIMKVKEIDRTANIAWSPAAHHPIYIAAGTAAQQLDATFSTTAALEIYALNLTEPGLDMCMKGSVVSDF